MLREMREIQALATEYSKADLGRMVQLGLLDPQKAMMAGMMIQRIERQNAKPPQATVAQEILGLPAVANQPQPPQQPQPQMPSQGVAALPPQGAPSAGVAALPSGIKEMAGGGIVAFDEGGEVPGYAGDEGSVVTSSPVGRAFTGFFAPAPGAVPAFNVQRDLDAKILQKTEELNQLGGMFGLAQQTPEQQQRYDQTKAELQALYEAKKGAPAASPAAPTTTPFVDARQAPPAAPATPAAPAAPTTGGKATTGGGGVPAFRPPSITRPKIDIPNFSNLEPEKYTARTVQKLEDIGKERIDYMKSLGLDPEMYTKMLAKEEGKRGELAKRKGEAKGEALMMAGLGLLGAREGQEFQALSESGAKGLAQLRESYKELRASEERLDDRVNALRIADQQAKQSGGEKDIAKRDAQQALVDAAERKAVEDRNTFATKRADLGMQGANIKTQAEMSLYGTDVRDASDRRSQAIQAQQVANQAAYHQKSLQLTESRIKQMDAATQARFGKLKLEAGKMWEGSDENRRLMGALKQKYGDNFMNVPAAQMQLQQARNAFVGYYLDQNDALIHAARDESSL